MVTKKQLKQYSLLLSFIFLLSCVKNKIKDDSIPSKQDYGKDFIYNKEPTIELNLKDYKDYDQLAGKIESIVCNDSIPIISFNDIKGLKSIYLGKLCLSDTINKIKQNNIIQVHNNYIIKNGIEYSLENLSQVLKKDYSNQGKNPNYSESPEKIKIFISYDYDGLKKLINTLSIITNIYDQLNIEKDLRVFLKRKNNESPPITPKPKKRRKLIK